MGITAVFSFYFLVLVYEVHDYIQTRVWACFYLTSTVGRQVGAMGGPSANPRSHNHRIPVLPKRRPSTLPLALPCSLKGRTAGTRVEGPPPRLTPRNVCRPCRRGARLQHSQKKTLVPKIPCIIFASLASYTSATFTPPSSDGSQETRAWYGVGGDESCV